MAGSPGIMEHLKETTRELHKEAESRPLQRRMARGSLDRESFVTYLGQLRHVHEALERALEEASASRPDLAALLTDERRRVPDLDRDLAALAAPDGAMAALPATERFVARIEAIAGDDPVALLGPLYVLEGSTNGGRFLARVLQRSLELEPGRGLSYMDPYGDRQPEMWARFKRDAASIGLTAGQERAVTEAACATFAAIAAISDAVVPPAGRESAGAA